MVFSKASQMMMLITLFQYLRKDKFSDQDRKLRSFGLSYLDFQALRVRRVLTLAAAEK